MRWLSAGCFIKATQQSWLLTEALDHVEAAVFLVDAKAGITFANDTAKKMLGEGSLVRKEGYTLRAAASDVNRILRDAFAAPGKGDASVGVRGVAVPQKNAL